MSRPSLEWMRFPSGLSLDWVFYYLHGLCFTNGRVNANVCWMSQYSCNKQEIYYLWFDCETTGTNVVEHQILELSFILTDANLNQVGEAYHSLVVPQVPDVKTFIEKSTSEFVLNMHTESGLLNEIYNLDVSKKSYDITSLDLEVVSWLESLLPDLKSAKPKKEIRISGRSIGSLDVPMMKKYMKELSSCVSHRTFDISQFEYFFTDACNLPTNLLPFKVDRVNVAHRAYDDNILALNQARDLQKWIQSKF